MLGIKRVTSSIKKLIVFLSIVFVIVGFVSLNAGANTETVPRQVVLTWQGSPQTTMTITWRTNQYMPNGKILYSTDPDNDYEEAMGSSETYEGTVAWINSVELTGLSPGTEYYVIIPHETNEERFKFRTAPQNPEEIVFVAGSDMHVNITNTTERSTRRALHAAAALEDPDFVVVAGDLLYDDGAATAEQNADMFFDDWHEYMITPDKRRIPIVPTEGNHDSHGYYDITADPKNPKDNARIYYNRFKLAGEERYYVLQYGPDLTIISLNSDHSSKITGEQTTWLKNTLKKHQDSTWILPFHHIGPYPAFRELSDYRGNLIRNEWVPSYEEYGVKLVLSGHDHTYKRTYPMKNGNIDEDKGIVYIGDGGWSTAREPILGRPYIYETSRQNTYFRITMSNVDDSSSLLVEPVFPLNPAYKGTPFVLSFDDSEYVARTKGWLEFDKLSNEDLRAVTRSLNLPTQAFIDTQIKWESSNTGVITNSGIVNRPNFSESDAVVTLTATMTCGEAVDTKEFVITVKRLEENISITVNNETRNVNVKGNYSFAGGKDIGLLVSDQMKNIYYVDQDARDEMNSFEFNFHIDENKDVNQYLLKIGSRERMPFETQFYLFPEVTDVQIERCTFSDSSGQIVDTLTPEREIYVDVGVRNNTDDDISTTIMAALYDSNNKLVGLDLSGGSIEGKKIGDFDVSIKLPQNVNGHFIKVYIWDSMANMRPIASKVIFPNQ